MREGAPPRALVLAQAPTQYHPMEVYMNKTYGAPHIDAEASVNAKTLAQFASPNTESSVPSKRI
jgi:hypothetical protein